MIEFEDKAEMMGDIKDEGEVSDPGARPGIALVVSDKFRIKFRSSSDVRCVRDISITERVRFWVYVTNELYGIMGRNTDINADGGSSVKGPGLGLAKLLYGKSTYDTVTERISGSILIDISITERVVVLGLM
ncbi:Leukocyte Elastase Inhibitor [Manis pentadactyla]|nr:Leukocyte Elastase Inhibitor [Manis pentadactyla]